MPPPRPASLAWALSRLPSSEFAVQFAATAEDVVTVVRDDVLVATATLVPVGRALSGAATTAAVVADDERAAAALAPRLLAASDEQSAIEVLGPGTDATVVAACLATLGDGEAAMIMDQLLWSCDTPRPPPVVAGRARPLEPGDHELVASWLDEFSVEALRLPPRGVGEWRAELAAVTGMRLWVVDDEPVSLALGRRTTPLSARIGPVYTPPDHRGHGYAAAVTAAVTHEWLAAGLDRVVLLTDTSNPTSNRLYARIGFVEVDRHSSWVVRCDR